MRLFKQNANRAGIVGAIVLAVGAVLVSAAVAVAADQTRESYVAQVEPICKANTKANQRILSGAEKKVKEGKLKAVAGQFTRAAVAFEKAIKQLRAVQQPTADTTKLTKWLKQLDKEAQMLREIGKALKSGNKVKAQTLRVRLTHNGNVANNIVLGFDFKDCLIDSSKFS